MKNLFKLLFVASMVSVLSVPSAIGLIAQAEDYKALIGTWDVEITEMGMQMQFIFKMEDGLLEGKLEFEMGSGDMEQITFEDNNLTFLVSLDAGGQVVNVEVSATVDEDKMTGTMFTEMGDVIFEGIKRKEEKTL